MKRKKSEDPRITLRKSLDKKLTRSNHLVIMSTDEFYTFRGDCLPIDIVENWKIFNTTLILMLYLNSPLVFRKIL